jgi:soluble lytic murein transglycosylase-like protein
MHPISKHADRYACNAASPSLPSRGRWMAIVSAQVIGLLASTLAAAAGSGLDDGAYRLKIDLVSHRLAGLAAASGDKPSGPAAPEVVAESPRVSLLIGRPFAAQIDRAALEASLDPALVHAVIFVESRYNPTARSPKGALGLMQVMPQTASRYGIRNVARSVEVNLRAGTRYLADLMQQFGGRLDLVLAAYNAGENAVIRHLGIPPYLETRRYVPAVLSKYEEWRDVPPAAEPPPAPVAAPAAVRVEYVAGTRLDSLNVASAR